MRSLLFCSVLCIAVAASASADTIELACDQTAQTVPGDAGTTFTAVCPAACEGAAVWGSGIYSDDSSICVAAIHAGVLTAGGGSATVTIAAGQDAYIGSEANGVGTMDWGSWGRSFVFGRIGVLDCYDSAQSLEGDSGATWTVSCPAGCSSGGTVWGSGTYSDDSAVCTAAIHAGVLSDGGGYATVRIMDGLSEYVPSTLNGVTTSAWGEWGRSFTFELGN